jgi:hypothetical protein
MKKIKIKEKEYRGEKGVNFESKEQKWSTALRVIIKCSSILGNNKRIFEETDKKLRNFNNIFALYFLAARNPSKIVLEIYSQINK